MKRVVLDNLSNELLVKIARDTWIDVEGTAKMNRMSSIQSLFVKSIVQSKNVVDLGSGNFNELITFPAVKLFELGIKSLVCVDFADLGYKKFNYKTINSKLDFVRIDAFSYLLTQDDNSMVIVANSLFSEPLTPDSRSNARRFAIQSEYLKRLMREMYRVSDSFCLGFDIGVNVLKIASMIGFGISVYDDKLNILIDKNFDLSTISGEYLFRNLYVLNK